MSVLMTVWNGEAYLREAIDSVFAQTFSRGAEATWELLLVDDGSTDGSAAIAREYCARQPQRVRLLQHRMAHHGVEHDGTAQSGCRLNRGISASRNLAMQHARAPVLAFLDCDDVFLPHHLETQLALLRRDPQLAMVYANAERWVHHARAFDHAAARAAWWGDNYIPALVPPGARAGRLLPGTLLRWILADESLAPCMCTVLVRSAAARAVGCFEAEFHGLYDDQVFHAKLSSRYPVYANPACTARYRQHPASCCAVAHGTPSLRETATLRFKEWLQAKILQPARTGARAEACAVAGACGK